jgi:hypothetical protein
LSPLPRVLQEISDIAGLNAALKVAEAKGGGRARFPVKVKPDHWLSKLFDEETADRIAFHFTSGQDTVEIDIPLGPAGTLAKLRQNMGRMLEAGVSSDTIARATGMSRRTVLRNKAKLKDDDDQGKLF